MNKRLKKILQYTVFFGIGLFLTYWQYSKMTAAEKDIFAESIKNANYIYLVPVVILSLCSHISRAIRWRYLMVPMGYKPLLSNTFATVMIGYLVNSLAPRAGEIAKCSLLGKREKIPFEKLIGTILIERAIDLLCYFVIILITVLLQYQRISEFVVDMFANSVKQGNMHPLLKLTLIVFIITIIVILIKYLLKKYTNHKLIDGLKHKISGVQDGFKSIKNLQNAKLFWFHTLLIWFCYLMQIYVGFNAMEFTQHLGIDASFAVLTLGTLAMILTPGGIGSFPIAVAKVLVLYNISNAQAESFGWVMWGATTAIIFVVGTLSFVWFEYVKVKAQPNENT